MSFWLTVDGVRPRWLNRQSSGFVNRRLWVRVPPWAPLRLSDMSASIRAVILGLVRTTESISLSSFGLARISLVFRKIGSFFRLILEGTKPMNDGGY